MKSRKSLLLLLIGSFVVVTIANARGLRTGPVTGVVVGDPVVLISPN